MKPQFFIKRCSIKVIFGLLLITSMSLNSYAQNSSNQLDNKSYVVVGAFSMQANASKFTSRLKEQGLDVDKKLNAQRNLYYVYAYEFDSRDDAFSKVKEVRDDYPDLYDAWIYTGNFESVYSPPQATAEMNKTENQEVDKIADNTDNKTEELSTELTENTDAKEEEISKPVAEVVEKVVAPKPKIKREVGHYYIYVNTVNSRNAKEVKGKVEIIDPVRAKRLAREEVHEIIDITDPNNGAGTVKVSPMIFGFKPVSRILDLNNPVSDSTSNYITQNGDSIIVNFELERFRKGDFAVLFNVYFYKDAAIMKEESVYELNQLRDMMLENKDMRIKIHGHTNGNSFGKVLHLDENDKDFFNLKGQEHKEAAGSAKKLSLYRAVTIKRWLMDQGVKDARMETKGWGGKRMLAGKHDTQAHKNVRVEIEVLADQ